MKVRVGIIALIVSGVAFATPSIYEYQSQVNQWYMQEVDAGVVIRLHVVSECYEAKEFCDCLKSKPAVAEALGEYRDSLIKFLTERQLCS